MVPLSGDLPGAREAGSRPGWGGRPLFAKHPKVAITAESPIRPILQEGKTPAAGQSKPKETGAGAAETPDAGAQPAPRDEGGAEPKSEKKRPDPTRYGDWEKNGRCIDF